MELTVNKVVVSIAGVSIVNEISLHVGKGKFVGMIGPNGCGKSTLLKTIYKVIKPERGAVLLNDMDVLKTKPRLISQKMAVVGQFNETSFDFTVHEMVMMGRTPHKQLLESDHKADYEIVNEALRRVEMLEYSERSYFTLSGGEKQRVILARAVAQQPELLVLDEPTNHLDIKYQLQLLSVVKSLRIGTLAALHDLSLAAMYCDILYAVKAGQIVASGTPDHILTKELIRHVYEIDCDIYTNPFNGKIAFAFNPDVIC